MSDAPFRVGGIVEPPYFVGRDEDLEILIQSVSNLSQNVLLLAPRRYGKSSLLHNLRKQLEGNDRLLIPSVNCLGITSYSDFHRITVAALLAEFERKRRVEGFLESFRISVKEKILTAFRHVEEIGGSIGEVGNAYLRFRESEIDELELLRAAFRFFRTFSEEKRVQIVFLMDEFQEVATFNGDLFKLLKKELDENSNTRYLFSGSSIRMLSSIFLREDAPLYLMVSRHQMRTLEQADVSSFIARRLAVAGLHVSDDAVVEFHSLTDGIPFYVQKLGFLAAQQAQLQQLKKVDKDIVRAAFASMLKELDSEFEARWGTRLTPQQRRIVRALAQLGNGSVTDISRQMGVRRTDISSALRRLRAMMVVSVDAAASHTLTDAVFCAWLREL